MILNILTISFESILFFISGFIFLSILSFIFRFTHSGKLYKILLGFIIINAVVHFLGATNPQQNSILLLFIVSFFYFFLFFILNFVKRTSTKIWKFKYYQVFILFICSLFLVGIGEFLESQSEHISPEISIGSEGEIFYNGFVGLKSNVGISNNYGENMYDTIRYDIDRDGFVDLKTVDVDDDGVIDDTIVYTYFLQKILLLIILFGSTALVYIFSHSGVLKNDDNEDDDIEEVEEEIEIDLSALKKGKKSKKNLKIVSGILIISMFFSQFGIVNAKRYEEMSTYEKQQTQEYKRGIEISEYFKKIQSCKNSGCEGVSTEVNNFLKNYYNNPKYKLIGLYVFSQFNQDLNKFSTNCGSGGYSTYSCGKNNSNIQLFNDMVSIIYPTILDFKYEKINDISKLSHSKYGFNIAAITAMDRKENPNDYDFLSTEGVTTPEEIKTIEIQEEIDTNHGVNNIVEDIVKVDKGEETELSPIEIEEITVDVAKDGKAITDISGGALTAINAVIGNTELSDIDELKKVAGGIGNNIVNTLGDDGMKVVDRLGDLGDKIKNLDQKTPKSSEKIKGNVGTKVGGIGKAIDTIGKIGTVFDIYGDYKDFDKRSGGNKTKTFLGTTTTTILKNIVGSNPIDVGLSLISGGFHLAGYEEMAESIEELSLGDRSKQLIQDAILHETDETIGAMDQTLDDLVNTMNNPNAGVLEKSGTFVSSTLAFTYGMGVFGVNQLLGGAGLVIDSIVGE